MTDQIMTENEKRIKLLKVNKAFEQQVLRTKSFNHIFASLNGLAIKKYVKTITGPLFLRRMDYWRTKDNNFVPGMLEIALFTDATGWDGVSEIPFRYNDNVIELYTDDDVVSFEALNKQQIENNVIDVYNEGVDYVYSPQDYIISEWIDHGESTTLKRPVDFMLTERTAPFEHNLRKSVIKRGN